MAKQIKAFIVRDDYVSPKNHEVSPIYELSEISQTYSLHKEVMYTDEYPKYALWSFGYKDENKLSIQQTNIIFKVVTEFVRYLNDNAFASSATIIPGFIANFNSTNPDDLIISLSYNNVIHTSGLKAPDFLYFELMGLECSIWLGNESFSIFYPDYDINIIFPFKDFDTKIASLQQTLTGLDNFDVIEFNNSIESDKGGYPPTYTKILNIPFKVPNSSVIKNCYFAFNVYGRHGGYDHVLKLYLYEYLTKTLGLSSSFVEERFPIILDINEFYIVPRWDKNAITAGLGQIAIGSHMTKAYTHNVDLNKYIKVFDDGVFLRDNSYNVPSAYNNLLLTAVNGYYTEDHIKDFSEYYSDILTNSSTSPDFPRMAERTQRFITLMENMLRVADSESQSEMFSKVIANRDLQFNIITRADVTYISIYFEDHQYYMIPKYEYINKS